MKNVRHFGLFLVMAILSITTLSSCKKGVPSLDTENVSAEIEQTKWVITRYDNTLTNQSFFPNDTLNFVNESEYTINDGSSRSYTYVEYVDISADSRVLTLKNCAIFGGTYSASFSADLLMEDEIGNLLFNGFNDNDIIVWMQRVN